jgi:competence protein ComEC
MVIGATIWMTVSRPDILIDENLKLIGLMTETGRAVSREKGQGFAARAWLENDGDSADQKLSFARFERVFGHSTGVKMEGWTVFIIREGFALEQWLRCKPRDILIALEPLPEHGPCVVIDPTKTAKTGALAIQITQQDARITSVLQTRGQRLWSPPDQGQ